MKQYMINTQDLEKASTLSEIQDALGSNFIFENDFIEIFEDAILSVPERLAEFKKSYLKISQMLNDKVQYEHDNMSRTFDKFNIPQRFKDTRLSDFPDQVQRACEDFLLQKKEGLFIYGNAGTGKTHLTTALIIEMFLRSESKITYGCDGMKILKPRQGYFISVPELFLEIRESFNADSDKTESLIIDKYSSDIASGKAFIVLDDLGAEKSSEWVQQTLYTIIDRRYRDMQRTVITSNLSLNDIANKISDRIASRIGGMCKIINLKGKDRRI